MIKILRICITLYPVLSSKPPRRPPMVEEELGMYILHSYLRSQSPLIKPAQCVPGFLKLFFVRV